MFACIDEMVIVLNDLLVDEGLTVVLYQVITTFDALISNQNGSYISL